MKKIWIVGAWADNYGDRVLQKANTDLLQNICPDCFPVYVNCQKTYFSPQLIDYMNRDADMLFLAGGGLIFNRPQDCSVSGWQWNIDVKNISKIKIPLVVNAIGYNKFPQDHSEFKSGMWENLQETIDHSSLFSVRNVGTYNVLKENGLDVSKIHITPDCGMFIKKEKYKKSIFNKSLKIGLNWASDRAIQRFGGTGEKELRLVVEWCKRMVAEMGATIYLIEHLMPNDSNINSKNMIHKIFTQQLGENGIILRNVADGMYPMFDYTAGFFADVYSKMDLVVGMRGHSMIIPFGLGVPTIGIGAHNKIKWFLEDVGLEKYSVVLNENNVVNNLYSLSESAMEDYHKIILKQQKRLQKMKCKKWFNKIKDILTK